MQSWHITIFVLQLLRHVSFSFHVFNMNRGEGHSFCPKLFKRLQRCISVLTANCTGFFLSRLLWTYSSLKSSSRSRIYTKILYVVRIFIKNFKIKDFSTCRSRVNLKSIYASYNAVNPTQDFKITLTQRDTVRTN